MRPFLPASLARALTLALPLALCGCTAIGIGLDVARRDPRAGEGAALSSLRKVHAGARMVVTKPDGSRLDGEYVGVGTRSSAAWRASDAARRESLQAWRTLPALGDTVRLVQSGVFRALAEYQGLSARGVLVRDAGKLECRDVAFADFSAIESRSGALGRDDLRARALDASVPTEPVVRLIVSGDRVELRPEDVRSWTVSAPAPRGPRWMLLGLLMDVAVLVWINTTFIYSG